MLRKTRGKAKEEEEVGGEGSSEKLSEGAGHEDGDDEEHWTEAVERGEVVGADEAGRNEANGACVRMAAMLVKKTPFQTPCRHK